MIRNKNLIFFKIKHFIVELCFTFLKSLIMKNTTIATLTTGIIIGILIAPARGAKSRASIANAYSGIINLYHKWFSSKDIDIEHLKREIAQVEDHLSRKSKVQINALIDNAAKKNSN